MLRLLVNSRLLIVKFAAAAAKLLQSCLTLCDPIDGSPPGSSIPGILQARILEWVAISFSNACMHAKSLQSCPTLCNPMDSSPPGSSVHGILWARILEWVAISFSTALLKAQPFPSGTQGGEVALFPGLRLSSKLFISIIGTQFLFTMISLITSIQLRPVQ